MNRAIENSPRRSPTTAANIGRILWGLVFIASSIVNLTVTLPNPAFYRTFADLTFFPFYRRLILNVAIPNAQLITALVVVFEFAVGVLTLSKGQAVRWGLIGTGAWAVFICPAMGWYTIGSPLFLIIPLLLLRYRYNRSLLGLILRQSPEESHA
jgi:hypothetical protein